MVIFSYILNLRLSLDTVLDPVSVPLLYPPPPKRGGICSWNQSLSNAEAALDTAESGYLSHLEIFFPVHPQIGSSLFCLSLLPCSTFLSVDLILSGPLFSLVPPVIPSVPVGLLSYPEP